jgi:hypothetical protein
MVLAGNHFGTRVVKNHLLGGAHALRFSACPTETPVTWGWSHAPFLGGIIADNILEDSEKGGVLGLEHATKYIKSSQGRTYMAVVLNRNVVRWSEPFLSRLSRSGAKALPPGLTLGFPPAQDPGEFLVKAVGNRLEAPARVRPGASLIIHAAEYNSQRIVNRRFSLPRGPATSMKPGRPPASSSSSTGSTW